MESSRYIKHKEDGSIDYDNVVNRAYDFKIVNNTLVYSVHDTRWNGRSLTEIGLSLDGTLKYQIFEGKVLKGELLKGQIINEMKLTYNSQGLPEETYLIIQGRTEPVLHQRHYTVLIEGQPGTYIVYAVDADSGVFEQIDEVVNGRQFDNTDNAFEGGILPSGTVIHSKNLTEAANMGQRDGRYFENGVFKYAIENKFSPIVLLIMISRTLLLRS